MKQNKRGQAVCASLWNAITEELTLSQYEKTMGGDMSYKAKAIKAMEVSRSKTVQALCIDLIQAYEYHFEPLSYKAELDQLRTALGADVSEWDGK
jgi:hypothetical protein